VQTECSRDVTSIYRSVIRGIVRFVIGDISANHLRALPHREPLPHHVAVVGSGRSHVDQTSRSAEDAEHLPRGHPCAFQQAPSFQRGLLDRLQAQPGQGVNGQLGGVRAVMRLQQWHRGVPTSRDERQSPDALPCPAAGHSPHDDPAHPGAIYMYT